MNIRLPHETKQRLEKLARRHGIKQSKLVRVAVEQKLTDWERKGVIRING